MRVLAPHRRPGTICGRSFLVSRSGDDPAVLFFPGHHHDKGDFLQRRERPVTWPCPAPLLCLPRPWSKARPIGVSARSMRGIRCALRLWVLVAADAARTGTSGPLLRSMRALGAVPLPAGRWDVRHCPGNQSRCPRVGVGRGCLVWDRVRSWVCDVVAQQPLDRSMGLTI